MPMRVCTLCAISSQSRLKQETSPVQSRPQEHLGYQGKNLGSVQYRLLSGSDGESDGSKTDLEYCQAESGEP